MNRHELIALIRKTSSGARNEIPISPLWSQDAIQSAIDDAAPNSVIVFPESTFTVSSALKFSGSSQDRTGLTYVGTGTKIVLADGVEDQNAAELTSGEDYAVVGIEFIGNKGTVTPDASDASYRYHNGLYVGATAGKTLSNVRVEGCTFRNCTYAGLMTGSGPVGVGAILPGIDYFVAAGNSFIECEAGVAGGAQRHATYSANLFIDCDIYGMLVDIDSVGVTVSGNTFKNLAVSGSINASVFIYDATNATVTANHVSGGKSGIIIGNGSDHCVVSGNTIRAVSASGLVLSNSDFGSVTGNTITDAGNYGISVLLDATQSSISGNVVSFCDFDGIALNGVSAISVSNNVSCKHNGSGIRLISSSGVSIGGNVCLNNNVNSNDAVSSGIRLTDTVNCTVVGNHCTDTQSVKTQNYGLREDGTSSGNDVANNRFTGNKTADVYP